MSGTATGMSGYLDSLAEAKARLHNATVTYDIIMDDDEAPVEAAKRAFMRMAESAVRIAVLSLGPICSTLYRLSDGDHDARMVTVYNLIEEVSNVLIDSVLECAARDAAEQD